MIDHASEPGTLADDQLADLVDELTERLQGGEAVDVSAVLAAYPDHADRLAGLLTTLGAAAALAAPPDVASGDDAGPPPNEELGDFRLIRKLGEGGMGVVYEADQRSLRRRVALKVLPYAAAMDPKQLQRFRTEAHAAAHLHHQNIVPVYAVGCERGVHYYAMQLIDGQSLAEVIAALRRQAGLPTREHVSLTASMTPQSASDPAAATSAATAPLTHRTIRGLEHCRACARLGVQAAEALEHAHQMGILHRDVKPPNLLVDSRGHLWVTDFGLARFQDDLGVTRTGDLVGTLRYMSPEQIDGRPDLVDERTDVYSLGATLYELLTLEPIFPGRDRAALVGQIQRDEPRPPRRINSAIPGELETVVLKALAKAPAERYRSAQELADDLRRFLDDRPIAARRPGTVLRLRRWARRHRQVVATAAASLVLLLVLAVVGLTISNALLAQERNQKSAQLADTFIKEGQSRRSAGFAGRRLESLDLVRRAAAIFAELGTLDELRRLELRNEAIACLALTDVRIVREWEGRPTGSSDSGFDADLEHYVRADPPGKLTVRRVEDGREVSALPFTGASFFSPDGNLLAVRREPMNRVQVWEWRHNRLVFESPHGIAATAMTFSPDSRRLALGQDDGTITVHDVATGAAVVGPIKAGVQPTNLSYSPDGARLAIASWGGQQVRIVDVATGVVGRPIPAPEGTWITTWHPGGVLLAYGCEDRTLIVWDTKAHRQHTVLRGHQGTPFAMGFAAGGDVLVSHSYDGTTRLWDHWAGREVVRFAGATHRVSRDGRRLASDAGRNLAVREVVHPREFRTLPRNRPPVKGDFGTGSFSPDGRLLALGNREGARIWDLAHSTELDLPPLRPTRSIKFHPRKTELLTSGGAGLYRWPFRQEADVLRVGPGEKVATPGQPGLISLDGEGRRLTAVEDLGWTSRGAWLVDLENLPRGARLLGHPRATWAAISPDGRWAATGTHHGRGLRVFDAQTGEELPQSPLIPEESGRVVFSPDGRWLVTASEDFRIWRTGSWEQVRVVRRDQSVFNEGAAFSPDSRLLALTVSLSGVRLLDPANERMTAELQAPDVGPISWMAFSPDGSQLALEATSGDVRVWNLRRIREQLRELGLDWDLPQYPPAPAVPPTAVKTLEFVGDPSGLAAQP